MLGDARQREGSPEPCLKGGVPEVGIPTGSTDVPEEFLKIFLGEIHVHDSPPPPLDAVVEEDDAHGEGGREEQEVDVTPEGSDDEAEGIGNPEGDDDEETHA